MIRIANLLLLIFTICFELNGQVDYGEISLAYGTHEVGFRHTELIDSTRSYSRMMEYSEPIFRPVSISIWEPAVKEHSSEKVTIKTYLEILKNEEEWYTLPFEYFFDWFYISPTTHNIQQAEYITQAIHAYQQQPTDLPIIIYSASYRASSTENFILCEYLASYGFTVIAIPSKGYDNLYFEGGTIKDAIAQSRDIDFVIGNIKKLGLDQALDIVLSGFSFGGLSHILNATNNHQVDAVVSLDGTVKYRPELLDESFDYSRTDFKLPFIHISQKDVPVDILDKEGLGSSINEDFLFYDSISPPIKYQIKAHHLSHTYFSSYGILFFERDSRQDPDYSTIKASHESLLVLTKSTLDALHEYLSKGSWDHDMYLNRINESGKFELIGSQVASASNFDFNDFVSLVRDDNYFTIQAIYDSIQIQYPDYRPAEGDLNTLALHSVFTKEGYNAGVNIFKFAISLYPESANLYDSLAEGYRYHGEKELATITFKKSLELNPNNENAIKRLRELGEE